MKVARAWLILVTSLLVGTGVAAETVAGLPLHVQKLNPKTVRVWVGDFISSTATVAIATRDGIVVVDTLGIPKIDSELRKVIARELGRDDFKVLINTHEHGDHTGGNRVYADCAIVGHELVPAGMAAAAENHRQAAGWLESRIAELAKKIEEAPAGSPSTEKIREELILDRLNLEADRSDAKPSPPNRTFSDRMTLRMGDTTFELYFTGGMHTASDIAIFVPEHGLLMTGDTMADVWLTDTPGCLASFIARDGVRHDFPLLLENWGRILQKKAQIKLIVTGHWNGELTLKGFEDRVNYIRTLWEGIQKGVKGGVSLQDLQAEYRLEERFPDLAKSPGFSPGNHASTVQEMYIAAAKLEPVATVLYALIQEGAPDAELRKVTSARGSNPPKYLFVESQINLAGYRFLQADRVAQAIRMFRANVELFPNSWNVYDSLGEALLMAGDTAGAEKMYEKSVSIKPDSKTGLDALQKIRGAAQVK